MNINFVFKGDNFIIDKIKQSLHLVFDEINAPNTYHLLPSGVRRIINYGYAEISKTVNVEDYLQTLEGYLMLIKEDIKLLRLHGLEEIILYLTFSYELQFNWEFSPEILGKFYELNITLAISAYKNVLE
jgi:hypothetical protein